MNFDNLHQILANLYQEMLPLCGNMIGVAKEWIRCFILRRISGLAGVEPCRTDRRISAASSFCHRVVHYVFPNIGVGNNQCRNESDRQGHKQYFGIAESRYESVSEAERRFGI